MIPVNVLAVRYLANASPALCRQLGAPEDMPALAMLTTDCDDATYIALDAATKAAEVEIVFVDRFSGSLVVVGDVSAVDSAIRAVNDVLEETLHFTPSPITKT